MGTRPHRDALTRLDRIREQVGQADADLVERDQACPRCGEMRVDELGLNEDGSVVIGQVSLEEREHLMAADPETFHVTDHYRDYPYVLARLKRLKTAELKLMLAGGTEAVSAS